MQAIYNNGPNNNQPSSSMLEAAAKKRSEILTSFKLPSRGPTNAAELFYSKIFGLQEMRHDNDDGAGALKYDRTTKPHLLCNFRLKYVTSSQMVETSKLISKEDGGVAMGSSGEWLAGSRLGLAFSKVQLRNNVMYDKKTDMWLDPDESYEAAYQYAFNTAGGTQAQKEAAGDAAKGKMKAVLDFYHKGKDGKNSNVDFLERFFVQKSKYERVDYAFHFPTAHAAAKTIYDNYLTAHDGGVITGNLPDPIPAANVPIINAFKATTANAELARRFYDIAKQYNFLAAATRAAQIIFDAYVGAHDTGDITGNLPDPIHAANIPIINAFKANTPDAELARKFYDIKKPFLKMDVQFNLLILPFPRDYYLEMRPFFRGPTAGSALHEVVVGAWHVGTVIDTAASRGSGRGFETHKNDSAVNVNVDVQWWSGDRLFKHFSNKPCTGQDYRMRSMPAIGYTSNDKKTAPAALYPKSNVGPDGSDTSIAGTVGYEIGRRHYTQQSGGNRPVIEPDAGTILGDAGIVEEIDDTMLARTVFPDPWDLPASVPMVHKSDQPNGVHNKPREEYLPVGMQRGVWDQEEEATDARGIARTQPHIRIGRTFIPKVLFDANSHNPLKGRQIADAGNKFAHTGIALLQGSNPDLTADDVQSHNQELIVAYTL
jgi:hypothetical protein